MYAVLLLHHSGFFMARALQAHDHGRTRRGARRTLPGVSVDHLESHRQA